MQVRNLEVKVQTREAEFEKYREEMMIRPECKIQAELSIAQLEKVWFMVEIDTQCSPTPIAMNWHLVHYNTFKTPLCTSKLFSLFQPGDH